MTIGPEPISRILRRSSLLGMALPGSLDLPYEPVEQVPRVVSPWSGLWVVLHSRARNVHQRETLDCAVVQVDVGELGSPEVCLPAHRLVVVDRPRAAGPQHREAVVLAGDLGSRAH